MLRHNGGWEIVQSRVGVRGDGMCFGVAHVCRASILSAVSFRRVCISVENLASSSAVCSNAGAIK